MRSGRTLRLRPDEFGPFPPYRLDSNALFIAFANTAEYGVHVQRKWGQPACAIDAYVEFRHYVNDGRVKSGEREKGFYGLGGALRYFCDDCDRHRPQDEMRDRSCDGPPFNTADSTRTCSTARRTPGPSRAWSRTSFRPSARCRMPCCARIFSGPAPCTSSAAFQLICRMFERIRDRWDGMQPISSASTTRSGSTRSLTASRTGASNALPTSCGGTGGPGRRTPTGRSTNAIRPFKRDGRTLSSKSRRCANFATRCRSCGSMILPSVMTAAARTPLWAYGTKTARNAPSNSQYIFGPAKWIRFLITPPPGRVLVHRDYKQQEVRIAAILSGDAALLQACESGDVYLGIAQQLGFVRDSMNPAERRAVRALFKTVVLGIQYGLGAALAGDSHRHFTVRSLRNSSPAEGALSRVRGVGGERGGSRRARSRNRHAARLVHADARPASIRARSEIFRSKQLPLKFCTSPASWRSGAASRSLRRCMTR